MICQELGAKYDELLAKFSTDNNFNRAEAMASYFDKQIDAIAKLEKTLAQVPTSVTQLQLQALKLATEQTKQTLILAAKSGVKVDLPGLNTEFNADGFKTLKAIKVVGLALRRLWPILKQSICSN